MDELQLFEYFKLKAKHDPKFEEYEVDYDFKGILYYEEKYYEIKKREESFNICDLCKDINLVCSTKTPFILFKKKSIRSLCYMLDDYEIKEIQLTKRKELKLRLENKIEFVKIIRK